MNSLFGGYVLIILQGKIIVYLQAEKGTLVGWSFPFSPQWEVTPPPPPRPCIVKALRIKAISRLVLPCRTCFTFDIRFIRSSSSPFPIGAAPHVTSSIFDKSYLSTNGCLAKKSAMGGTIGAIVTCVVIHYTSLPI